MANVHFAAVPDIDRSPRADAVLSGAGLGNRLTHPAENTLTIVVIGLYGRPNVCYPTNYMYRCSLSVGLRLLCVLAMVRPVDGRACTLSFRSRLTMRRRSYEYDCNLARFVI